MRNSISPSKLHYYSHGYVLISFSEELAQYPDLEKTYEATTFQVVSRVLKALTGKKVTPPGSLRK